MVTNPLIWGIYIQYIFFCSEDSPDVTEDQTRIIPYVDRSNVYIPLSTTGVHLLPYNFILYVYMLPIFKSNETMLLY